MATHELKTWPGFFSDVAAGIKPFEVRRNDRNFQLGDTLILREYNPDEPREPASYTGAAVWATVTYVLPGGQFGIEEGFCVLGIRIEWAENTLLGSPSDA